MRLLSQDDLILSLRYVTIIESFRFFSLRFTVESRQIEFRKIRMNVRFLIRICSLESQSLSLTSVEVPTFTTNNSQSPPTTLLCIKERKNERSKHPKNIASSIISKREFLNIKDVTENSKNTDQERNHSSVIVKEKKMAFLSTTSRATYLLLLLFILGERILTTESVEVTSTCLGCICEATSNCNATVGCDGSVCGPFRITWAYWVDAGKPKLNDGSNDNDSYTQCTNDLYCAADTLKRYMDKFVQDCNGDGVVDCDDFLRIHQLGGYGCSGSLNSKFENTYKHCIQTYGKSITNQ
ncbi:uncharacterized protein LOC143178454 [Calliopsis andreniformis]|uniref:uncharacterized protein LOC143178454 n=1 Tax=Calliopsis andreniformis TaxID=337506 RepID=UPI003FCE5E56